MLGTRVGHSGTLDPNVSGVLVVMLGNAVRLARILLKEEKEYICLMRLHGPVSRENLDRIASEFTGKIYQRPPKKSAVKRNLRIRTIHRIDILDVRETLVLFRVHCDAGTYIRSLSHHMGLALCSGAHMQELRRVRSGEFAEQHAVTLQQIRDAVTGAEQGDPGQLHRIVLPVETVSLAIPKVAIRDTAVDAVCHGAALAAVGILEKEEFGQGDNVAILTRQGKLVGLGEALLPSSAFHQGDTGLVIAPRTIFMKPGTYPKGWREKEQPKRDTIKKTG
jgi:predicted rRNA pseudouridine synthase